MHRIQLHRGNSHNTAPPSKTEMAHQWNCFRPYTRSSRANICILSPKYHLNENERNVNERVHPDTAIKNELTPPKTLSGLEWIDDSRKVHVSNGVFFSIVRSLDRFHNIFEYKFLHERDSEYIGYFIRQHLSEEVQKELSSKDVELLLDIRDQLESDEPPTMGWFLENHEYFAIEEQASCNLVW